MEHLVSIISLTLLRAHSLDVRFVHFDTTNKQVQGIYEGEGHDPEKHVKIPAAFHEISREYFS